MWCGVPIPGFDVTGKRKKQVEGTSKVFIFIHWKNGVAINHHSESCRQSGSVAVMKNSSLVKCEKALDMHM